MLAEQVLKHQGKRSPWRAGPRSSAPPPPAPPPTTPSSSSAKTSLGLFGKNKNHPKRPRVPLERQVPVAPARVSPCPPVALPPGRPACHRRHRTDGPDHRRGRLQQHGEDPHRGGLPVPFRINILMDAYREPWSTSAPDDFATFNRSRFSSSRGRWAYCWAFAEGLASQLFDYELQPGVTRRRVAVRDRAKRSR